MGNARALLGALSCMRYTVPAVKIGTEGCCVPRTDRRKSNMIEQKEKNNITNKSKKKQNKTQSKGKMIDQAKHEKENKEKVK